MTHTSAMPYHPGLMANGVETAEFPFARRSASIEMAEGHDAGGSAKGRSRHDSSVASMIHHVWTRRRSRECVQTSNHPA